jgi:hypothetical protein
MITRFSLVRNLNNKGLMSKLQSVTIAKFLSYNFLIFFPIFLLQAWFVQYVNSGLPFDYVSRLSFIIVDTPWMPDGIIATPLLGSHYFGDLILGIAYGDISNPYDRALILPSQIPPIGIVFQQIFSFFGQGQILFLFLFINFIALTVVTWLCASKNWQSSSTPILFLFVVTSYPLIHLLDRGAVHLIAIAFVVLSLYLYSQNRLFLSLITMVLACSIRPQIVLIVILLFVLIKKGKHFLVFIFILVLSNLITLLLFFKGNIISQISTIFYASSRYVGQPGDWGNDFFILHIADSSSLVGAFGKILGNFYGSEFQLKILDQYSEFLFLPGLLYLLMLFVIVISKSVQFWLKFCLILSTFSLFLPASMTYTQIWTMPAILILSGSNRLSESIKRIVPNYQDFNPTVYHKNFAMSLVNIMFVYGLIFSSIFHIWSIEGCCGNEYFNFGEYFGPFLILSSTIFLFLILIKNRIFKTNAHININS